MWHLMSRDGPEVLIGEYCHTARAGLRCKVLAILEDSRLVRVERDDGTVGTCRPEQLGCYLLDQDHPQ